MTLFIITVTDESAYVSQDTFCSHLLPNTAPLDDFATVNLADDQSNARATTGIASPTDKLKTFTSKIVAVPHMHMVMGGAGHHELIMAWAQVLTVIPARDLVELDSILPDAIKHVAAIIKTKEPAMVYHVGLDKNAGRMAGYLYNAANGYRSTRLGPGHAMMPMPAPTHEGYEKLAALWTPAARGEDTENFHVLMAKNQHDSFWRGHYKHGSGIGGQLHTARIDHDGIRVRVFHEFPGYAEQSIRLDGVQKIAADLAAAAHRAQATASHH